MRHPCKGHREGLFVVPPPNAQHRRWDINVKDMGWAVCCTSSRLIGWVEFNVLWARQSPTQDVTCDSKFTVTLGAISNETRGETWWKLRWALRIFKVAPYWLCEIYAEGCDKHGPRCSFLAYNLLPWLWWLATHSHTILGLTEMVASHQSISRDKAKTGLKEFLEIGDFNLPSIRWADIETNPSLGWAIFIAPCSTLPALHKLLVTNQPIKTIYWICPGQ